LKLFKSQIIDLVISDHLLPDPTGAELTGKMKRQRPFVPVIIYSGVIDALPGTEHVDLFTSNAGGPSELLEKVAELLRPSRIAGGNYFAEIRCDRRFDPFVWHYTVQRLRSPEILAWCQVATEKEAIRDARRALRELNEPPPQLLCHSVPGEGTKPMVKKPEMEFDPEAFEKALDPNSKEKARRSEALENERTARETEKPN
ncbi:MAG TPA: hypothetical protein VJA94_16465, partial [Candidatus Angelobacter sp.]